VRVEEEKQLALKNKVSAPAINNEFIGKIIANKGPNLDNILNPILGMAGASSWDAEKQESAGAGNAQVADLKLSSFVIELEILPKPKIETYEREFQCDLISQEQANAKQKESMEEEKMEFSESPSKKGHHISQGIVTGIVAPSADQFPNQDNQKEDEKKEEFQILSKDDSKAIMRTKEFETFIDKTSKILERALTGSEDILGPSIFFEDFDGDEEGLKALSDINNSSKDKLNSMFTFQDNVATQRTVTSLQWSPSVSTI